MTFVNEGEAVSGQLITSKERQERMKKIMEMVRKAEDEADEKAKKERSKPVGPEA